MVEGQENMIAEDEEVKIAHPRRKPLTQEYLSGMNEFIKNDHGLSVVVDRSDDSDSNFRCEQAQELGRNGSYDGRIEANH